MIDIVFPKAKPFPKQLFYFVPPPGTYSRHSEAKILEVDTMKHHFKIKTKLILMYIKEDSYLQV